MSKKAERTVTYQFSLFVEGGKLPLRPTPTRGEGTREYYIACAVLGGQLAPPWVGTMEEYFQTLAK